MTMYRLTFNFNSMIKFLKLIALSFLLTWCPSFISAQLVGAHEDLIVIGKRDSIYSTVLDELRDIWVYVPESARVPGKKFPVVYLLDGDAHFYSVMGMIQQLSTVNGNSVCPEMIVVGIPNTDRTRDLTPTHVREAMGDSVFVKTSGGLPKFTSFIADELMPYIESHYPVTPYKMYIGHSLGGLAVLYAMFNRPEIFTSFVAIDPSLWWDNGVMLTMMDSLEKDAKFERKSLYLAAANTMPSGMDYSQVRKDTTMATEHLRAIIKFANSVNARKPKGMDFKWKYYEEDNHGSVPLIATYDALHFLFSWYALDNNMLANYINPGVTGSPKQLIDLLNTHFKTISEHYGYVVLPDEHLINSLGYQFMETRKMDMAYACFDLNIKNFPQSTNVYDSMGDYYVAKGDTVKAIESFSKALEIEEVPYTRAKLKDLQKK